MFNLKQAASRAPGGALVLDGGLATELEARGENLNDTLWSARLLKTDPALIERVHASFVAAGADMVSSASYQCSYAGFAAALGLDEAATTHLLQLSVRLARQSGARLVAASMGPYGAPRADGSEYTGYAGTASVADMVHFHGLRSRVLWAAKPDVLLYETIPCADEARAIAQVLRDQVPDAPAIVSFQCRDDTHLASGATLAQAVAVLAALPNVVGVGVNCCSASIVLPLYHSVASLLGSHQAFVAYPNGGGRWDPQTQRWHHAHDQRLPEMAREWVAAGVALVGGCCQVGPAEIARIRASVEKNSEISP